MTYFQQCFLLSSLVLIALTGCSRTRNGLPVNWRGETPREERLRISGADSQSRPMFKSGLTVVGSRSDKETIIDLYTTFDKQTKARRTYFDIQIEAGKGLFQNPTAKVRYVDESTSKQGAATAVFKEDALRKKDEQWQSYATKELPKPTASPSRYFRHSKFTVNFASLINQKPQVVAKALGKSKAYRASKDIGANGQEVIRSETCRYGERPGEIITVFYNHKKAVRFYIDPETGVAPHVIKPEQIGKALNIKKMQHVNAWSVDGPTIVYRAENVKPFGMVSLTPSIYENGVSHCVVDLVRPKASPGK